VFLYFNGIQVCYVAVVSAAESHYSILEVSKETEGGILAYYQGFNRSNGKGKLHRIPQSI
jgi:hypothetical protein